MNTRYAMLPLTVLLLLAGESGVTFARGAEPPAHPRGVGEANPERVIWKASGRLEHLTAVARYLEDSSGSDTDLLRISELIKQLGSTDFSEREDATKRLADLRPITVPALKRAFESDDPEIRQRARDSLLAKQKVDAHLPAVAVRLLARAGGPACVEPLLRYLPYASDQEVESEIYVSLGANAAVGGKVHPALRDALTSKVPARRAAAGGLVLVFGSDAEKAAAAKLLSDPDPLVRLRVAQGLAVSGDERGDRALVELLTATPVSVAWQAEEVLRWRAGKSSPAELVWAGGARATAARAAWERWCLGRPKGGNRPAPLSRPLLLWTCAGLIGHDGVVRWTPDATLGYELQQFLPGDRMLATRPTGRQIERNGRSIAILEIVECELGGKKITGTAVESESGGFARQLPDGRTVYVEGSRVVLIAPSGSVAGGYDLRDKLAIRSRPDTPERAAAVSRITHCRLQVSVTEGRNLVETVELSATGAVLRHDTHSTVKDREGLNVYPQSDGHQIALRRGAWEDYDTRGELVATMRGYAWVRRIGPDRYFAYDPERYRFIERDVAGRIYSEIPDAVRGIASLKGATVDSVFGLAWAGLGVVPLGGPDLDRDLQFRLTQLSEASTPHRFLAARAICELPKLQTSEAAPGLMNALASTLATHPTDSIHVVWPLRTTALQALTAVGKDSWPAVVRAATHPDSSAGMRAAGVAAVGRLHAEKQTPADSDPWAILTRALRDTSPLVRVEALLALQAFRSDKPADVVKALGQQLADPETAFPATPAVGWWAARCLSAWGTPAKSAVPNLITATKGKHAGIRAAAVEALAMISKGEASLTAEVLPVIRHALKDKAEPAVRSEAARALATLGPAAKEAVPDLIGILEDSQERDADLRRGTLSALRQIGPSSAPAVPVLIAVAKHSNSEWERAEAIRAIGAIGRAAAGAVPALKGLAMDSALGPVTQDALRAVQGESP